MKRASYSHQTYESVNININQDKYFSKKVRFQTRWNSDIIKKKGKHVNKHQYCQRDITRNLRTFPKMKRPVKKFISR